MLNLALPTREGQTGLSSRLGGGADVFNRGVRNVEGKAEESIRLARIHLFTGGMGTTPKA